MTSLEFAINLELEGEKYYRKQAELNKDNYLKVVFDLLAKDEKKHAEKLKNRLQHKAFDLKESSALKEVEDIFSGLNDFITNLNDESQKQLKAYDEALAIEKQSIELYEKLHVEAQDAEDKMLFAYLIGQENEHYDLFFNIITLLNRPNEWVEDAEFGLREEY